MKFLGQCPCPHCPVAKDKIYKLGSKIDEWVHHKRAQVDNERCQQSIETVRRSIFEFGCSVASKVVESIIGPTSLVPTQVHSHTYLSDINQLMYLPFRMPSLRN